MAVELFEKREKISIAAAVLVGSERAAFRVGHE
jgi:hypothetical protein